jgi:hypothetical protein
MEGVITRTKKAQLQAQGDTPDAEMSLIDVFNAEPDATLPKASANSADPRSPHQDAANYLSPHAQQATEYPARSPMSPQPLPQTSPTQLDWKSTAPVGWNPHQYGTDAPPARGLEPSSNFTQPSYQTYQWEYENRNPRPRYERRSYYDDTPPSSHDGRARRRNSGGRGPGYRGRNDGPINSRSGHLASQIKVVLPKFDGRTRWKTFINQFEAITEDWTPDQKLYHMLSCLSGDAADFVFELETRIRASYSLLRDELERRFKTTETPQTCARHFYRRKLRSGETIKNFAADLKTLVRKAYPQGLDRSAMEQMLIKQFFDGLEDDDLRYNVEYLKMPKDLDDAVDLVYEHDEFRRIKRENTRNKVHAIQPLKAPPVLNSTGPGRSPLYPPKRPTYSTSMQSDSRSELKEVMQALAKLTTQMNNLLSGQITGQPIGQSTGQPTQMKTEPQERKCYNCGKLGHFKRQCPEVKTDQVKVTSAVDDETDCEEEENEGSSLEIEDQEEQECAEYLN